ncbi:MAG: hypothetical protein WCG96_08000 [Actinomycetes bacterium]
MRRPAPATAAEAVAALVAAPYAEELGVLIADSRVGRRRKHPAWLPVTYAALARHFRSANHLDAEMASGLWATLRREAIARSLPDPGGDPYTYAQHAYWRERAIDDEVLDDMLSAFTRLSLEHARSTGLLLESGGGSVTHPHPTRTIYGDGTIVRPIFGQRTIEAPDDEPEGGEDEDDEEVVARQDESAATHHRHDGPIYGNNFVIVSARGQAPGSRVVLGIDRVEAPGKEAMTSVALMERIVAEAGPGIQAAVYDGAFVGTHIDRLMRSTGLVVINRQRAASRTEDEVVPKRRALGIFEHQAGEKTCSHSLHTENGQVVDMGLADDGSAVVVASAVRRQVKRFGRKDGTYRFTMAVEIPCRHGAFTVWLSPHATAPGDTTPEHVRLIPPADPDFNLLYGLRNDAESFNSAFKRSLLVDRAASVGWRRQLFDLLGFVVLQNSLNWLASCDSSMEESA